MRPRNRNERRLMVHRDPQFLSIQPHQLAQRPLLPSLDHLQPARPIQVPVILLRLLRSLLRHVLRRDPDFCGPGRDEADAHGGLLHDQEPDEGHVGVVDVLGRVGGMVLVEVGDEVAQTGDVATFTRKEKEKVRVCEWRAQVEYEEEGREGRKKSAWLGFEPLSYGERGAVVTTPLALF